MLVSLAAFLAIASDNTLSRAEMRDGWRLLFNGKSTKGWHNFKEKGVAPGWTVADGVLTCSNPGNAGDLLSDDRFEWFELSLDYRLTVGGNSGILFRVQDAGEQSWHSGPEIQIYDHRDDVNPQKTGWLYQLYSSPVDATHPPGQWNHMRVLVSPSKCETDINGVKYYEYVIDSPDFWQRVAKSKFAEHAQFARAKVGSIGIQGDHGVVSFKNIKIRPIVSRNNGSDMRAGDWGSQTP
ncbi:MAG: DUF1080 domain-containing protein [Armatimonadetes bacterium]|nr:DUF1080 domain-containing protein [Armatimonadota bacterium]